MRRFHGGDDIFIQVDNEILSIRIFSEHEGFFRDSFVDVANCHVATHIQTPQILHGTSYHQQRKLMHFMT